MDKAKVMFDGIEKICKVTKDRNGEWLCEAEDGDFTKFPSEGDLEEMIYRHNLANSKEVEIIPEIIYDDVITFDSEGKEIK